MYSQCPECLTRFRVTAAALRVARGTVRCGRCGSAFDALPQLTDTLPDDSGFPAAPAALGFAGATGPEVPADSDSQPVPEFQFSADDIEQVFLDVRDWQSRFGAADSPGDRAGRLGESGAGLAGLLFAPDDDFLARVPQEGGTERDPDVWVHEPEAVEDITLEGERIQIEGNSDTADSAEEERLEREIAVALDEQDRAEIAAASGIHQQMHDDAGLMLDSDGPQDLDSTDRFAVLAEPPAEMPDADEAQLPQAMTAAAAAAAAAVATAAVAGPAIAAATAAAATVPTAPSPPPEATPPAVRWQRPWPADPRPEPGLDLDEEEHQQLAADLAVAAGERRGSWAWGVGALLLALALAAQWIHQHRQDFARDARVGPALRGVYSSLGIPLAPSWDLAAFQVRQWGASEAPPADGSTMTVRASLKNGASFAQPMPLLRLEFEDRFGATVARRDFEPREYLEDPAQATRLLAAGATTAAALAIIDAAAEAVGYRLDVCMRNDDGAVSCAQTDSGLP
jgi:predicted Zn finger-like uncharacterized protein